MKSDKTNRESVAPILLPLEASAVQASVNLVPPTADGTEVQEKATGESAADMQRYVQLADKLLDKENNPETGKPEQKNKTGAASSAA